MPRLAPPISRTSTSTPSAASLTLHDALDRWYTYLRGSDRIGSPRTLVAYQYATDKLVNRLTATTPLTEVTASGIESMLADLREAGLSAAGRMAVYRPCSTFFRWCVKRGYLSVSPMGDIEPPKVKVKDIEHVNEAEWTAILRTCGSRSRYNFRGRRDLAILTILGSTGARVSEVANLKVGDIDFASGTILVHGKGGKDRLLPILPDTESALTTYMRHERPRSPYASTSFLWVGPKGAVTASGIAQMCAERGKAAGVQRRVHPHEFRHRFIARAMAKGMPGPLVMALSGHSTPAMLNRYGSFNRQQDAMDMLREMAARAS